MYPLIWGPCVWKTLHLLAYAYPYQPSVHDQQSMMLLIVNLLEQLPCPACSHHAKIYETQHPVNTTSKSSLLAWVNAFHNNVNHRLGKRTYTDKDSNEIISEWIKHSSQISDTNRTWPIWLAVVLFVMLGIFFYIVRVRKRLEFL